ncbi:hypothetical protein DM02DRAFT_669478 [Periconia macrospinosa]|uniref:Polycomb protein VEFS-Box domain-containing protein n=1 Tax=Periconia macrospinosa TaxID=97972 RepID=A0A2V1E0J6_9PLEO|nr:hypothetical protein DM02DRAFT_669478 [Periconia macrospinosa]
MGNRLSATLWEAATEHQNNNTEDPHYLPLARSMVKRQESYIGNLLFYDYVQGKRTPTFLQRNLADALYAHHQELETGSWRLPSSIERRSWQPPSLNSLNAIMKSRREQEALVIDLIGIEPLKLDKSYAVRPPRKKAPFFIVYVDINIAILDPGSGLPSHEITKKDVKMAGLNSEKGKVISLDSSSIEIPVENLLLPKSSTRIKPWNLRITVRFRETKDAKDFHSQMSPAPSTPGDYSMQLVMLYKNILRCPSKTEVYPFTTDGVKNQNLGLKLSVCWRTPIDESILATHNRRLRSSGVANALMPPPPDPPQHTQYEIVYVFPDQPDRRLTMKGLACPHTPCATRTFSNIDQLRQHLDSLHDLFKYQCRKSGTFNGVERWELTCEVNEYQANHKRASNAAPDPREVQVLAPSMPFDQRKYLDEGNDDFQKEARLEISRRPPARSTRSSRSARLVAQNSTSYMDDMEKTRESKGKKKIYVVPKAPSGVTFFRAVTKRPLQEGECVSESDDEVDTEWVQHRRNVQNDADPTIPAPAKRFLRLFDPFIRNERLLSDQRLGSSMVRFARLHTDSLWQEDIVEEFKTKLDELLEDQLIRADAHRACLDIVQKNKPSRATLPRRLANLNIVDEARRSQSPMTRSRAASDRNPARRTISRQSSPPVVVTTDAQGDVEMRDLTPTDEKEGHLTSNEQTNDDPPYDLCLCGEDAMDSLNRPFVVCDNVDCIRHAYHIDCIKRHWQDVKPPEPPKPDSSFTCNECRSSYSSSV